MAIFGWQTAIIKFERDKTANRRLPSYWGYSIYDNRMGGGDWTEFYVTPEEKFYTGALPVCSCMHEHGVPREGGVSGEGPGRSCRVCQPNSAIKLEK